VQVRFGGFMAGGAAFDAAVFGITGAEAELMDPQQRLLMEVRHSFVISLDTGEQKVVHDGHMENIAGSCPAMPMCWWVCSLMQDPRMASIVVCTGTT
jgi:Beta-ketoacyl synthase, N-terminal domain